MYVVIAVFFEEKRTHLVYFTWAHFFYYGKMNLWSNFFSCFYLDDNDNCWWLKQCFFYDFFDIRVRIAGTSIFIFFFSFLFNLEKSVKCPKIWASIMWVYLWRWGEQSCMIWFSQTQWEINTFWRSILVFLICLTGGCNRVIFFRFSWLLGLCDGHNLWLK